MKTAATTLALLGLFASACASQTQEGPAATGAEVPAPTPTSEQAVVEQAEAAQANATRPPLPIARSLHADPMREIVVGPRGHVALTLDREGGVRLWPDLRADAVGEPVELPVREPAWMSVAQAGDGYLAAFVDTTGAARVGRVRVTDDGGEWIPLFEREPDDPLFELHVLEGGDRIIALGVDHRIHLWDAGGDTVAMLDQVGFVPWQLRVGQIPGESPKVLAVLAGPVRVQPLTVSDDGIEVVGEARQVALDRGPNRNDLAMSPDGSTVTALRRPKARKPRFELEIIDIASGERKIIAAESDLSKRPRIHPIDGTQVLVESGTGQGFAIAFDDAMPWPPADGEPDREAIPLTALRGHSLPGSSRETRFHSVVTAGVRFVPSSDSIVVDPLDAGHRTIAAKTFRPISVGLDADGSQVAWGTTSDLVVEAVADGGVPRVIEGVEGSPALVAFAAPDRVVAMGSDGSVALRSVADGSVLATSKVPVDWGLAQSGWRPSKGAGGGEIVYASLKPSSPAHVLPVDETAFGSLTMAPKAERAQWPEAGKPRNMDSEAWLRGLGLDKSELGIRERSIRVSEPSPDGKRIALVQISRSPGGEFDLETESWIEFPDFFVVTVFDRESGKRLWTREVEALADVAWSRDSKRFALASPTQGGVVCDAKTGETVHERHTLGLEVTEAG